MFKKIGEPLLKIICQVALLKRSIRWFVRRVLHCTQLPSWFDRVITGISNAIPLDDIQYFEEDYMGNRIICMTKPNDHWVVSKLYWRGCTFVDGETIALFCKRSRFADTILDVGTNWGYYTLLAGAVAPHAKIIAFEPHPFWFKQLENNVSMNHLKNVRIENYAVGEIDNTSLFYLDNEYPCASSMVSDFVKGGNVAEVMVNVTSIDSYLSRQKLSRKIDLIKIDVETYESAVLAGAKSVLRKFRPDIICEVLPDENMGYRIANRNAIQDILTEFGYNAYWISDQGLIKEDVVEGHYPFSNYLFTTHLHS